MSLICNAAPVYVDRNSPDSIADAIIKLKNDKEFYSNVVLRQKKELSNYPLPKEKVELQLNFLKSMLNYEKVD